MEQQRGNEEQNGLGPSHHHRHHRHHHHNHARKTRGPSIAALGGIVAAVAAVLLLAFVYISCRPKEQPKPVNKVVIESTPEEGAQVLVAGEDRGPTPVTVEGLEPGRMR